MFFIEQNEFNPSAESILQDKLGTEEYIIAKNGI